VPRSTRPTLSENIAHPRSAIILLGTAILAASLLRHVRRPAPEAVTV